MGFETNNIDNRSAWFVETTYDSSERLMMREMGCPVAWGLCDG